MKNIRKWLILAGDVLLIPGLFFCEWLTDRMLSISSPCMWTYFGGKCITCGGTHFVNTLLNGQIVEAFFHNELLFVITLVLAVSLVFLNLYWLFDVQFAKKVLLKIYNIPVLIITVSVTLLFLFVRNIPAFINIAKLLIEAVQKANMG